MYGIQFVNYAAMNLMEIKMTKIYVVLGEKGEYSSHRVWVAACLTSKEETQEHVSKANEFAKTQAKKNIKKLEEGDLNFYNELYNSPFDKERFYCDLYEISYFIEECELKE